jgi:hypothetical protein
MTLRYQAVARPSPSANQGSIILRWQLLLVKFLKQVADRVNVALVARDLQPFFAPWQRERPARSNQIVVCAKARHSAENCLRSLDRSSGIALTASPSTIFQDKSSRELTAAEGRLGAQNQNGSCNVVYRQFAVTIRCELWLIRVVFLHAWASARATTRCCGRC